MPRDFPYGHAGRKHLKVDLEQRDNRAKPTETAPKKSGRKAGSKKPKAMTASPSRLLLN
jgi:hypothetical protein